MHRRALSLTALLFLVSLPVFGSQFIEQPFDQIARDSRFIVRGTIVDTFSRWDDAHEVIYTYATIRVTRYFGETTGPDTLVVREVGGTVDGYTQEAIGFPAVRRGEDVVFFLAPWDDASPELRIHAFNQGKFLVKTRGGREVVMPDTVHQGEERLENRDARGFDLRAESANENAPALGLDELAQMIDDARAGKHVTPVLEQSNDRQ